VVDVKRIIGKMEGRGGGEAQGVANPPNNRLQKSKSYFFRIQGVA
jgi:hypothetical protein